MVKDKILHNSFENVIMIHNTKSKYKNHYRLLSMYIVIRDDVWFTHTLDLDIDEF